MFAWYRGRPETQKMIPSTKGRVIVTTRTCHSQEFCMWVDEWFIIFQHPWERDKLYFNA